MSKLDRKEIGLISKRSAFLRKKAGKAKKSIFMFIGEGEYLSTNAGFDSELRRRKEKIPKLIIKIIAGPLMYCQRRIGLSGMMSYNGFVELNKESLIELWIRPRRTSRRHFFVIDEKEGWVEKRHLPMESFEKKSLRKMASGELERALKFFQSVLTFSHPVNQKFPYLMPDALMEILMEDLKGKKDINNMALEEIIKAAKNVKMRYLKRMTV